ncbi:MAG: DUF2924 domain-containing protein [Roseitalea porphyridii]|uniref:DUF2924 domain-containing protein n=1 Tax=Roseitalea porphyridii TaxID=1852022 RepID=UPI0032D91C5F
MRPDHDADALSALIAELDRADLDGLRARWRHHFEPPPKLRSVELLRPSLAWRLQAAQLGGLDAKARKQLRRRGPVQAEGLDLGVGARLRRQWKGTMVEMVVEAEGFRFDGTLYPSLSAAATAIAGTRRQPLDEGLRIGHLRATRGGDVGDQPFERVVIDGGVFPGHR